MPVDRLRDDAAAQCFPLRPALCPVVEASQEHIDGRWVFEGRPHQLTDGDPLPLLA